MIYVGAQGPSNARLAIVGEAPGGEEERLGYPFAGATGKIVRRLLSEIGTSDEATYLTNVVKVRPPNNEIRKLNLLGKTIEDFVPQLHEELRQLDPFAVIALGDTALQTLTGQKGIKKWRGSILSSRLTNAKIIPTIHPAALLHSESDEDGGIASWKDLTYIRWDFERALQESRTSEWDLPKRSLRVARNSLDVFEFFDRYKSEQFLSVDIETFRTVPLCIGFAFNSYEGLSVPLFNILSERNPTGIGRSDMCHIWKECARVLNDPRYLKIGQNFKFDQLQLDRCVDMTVNFGMPVRGFFFDTQLAMRTLYCELPASLQFITSVLTKEPYYKDEGKEYDPKKDKLDRLLLYNARDAVVTYEAFEKQLAELKERGLEQFFFERVMPLHSFYSRLEHRGILIDKTVRSELDEKYKMQQSALEDELMEITGGIPINVNSNGPRGQVARLLFIDWKLPVRKSTDEKTLRALMNSPAVKDPRHKRGIELILEIRKVRKVRGTYIKAEVHPDGRMRTAVRIALETGRTSTNILKPPVTTQKFGLAFQTITKHGEVGSDLREMFVPDPGYVFLEPDLSQAEARVVALLARDERLLKMFDYKVDTHRVTKGWIDSICPDSLLSEFWTADHDRSVELAKQINEILKALIDDEERQLGKKFRHAANYDMGERVAAVLANVTVFRSRKILQRVHDTNPNIRNVFHAEIVDFLNNNDRKLVNPFGRERQFLNRWGHELFKEAYAQLPQSTISDQNKFAAQRVEKQAPWLRILAESHDAFLALCPNDRIDEAAQIMKAELETPIDFSRCSLPRGELVIPCEVILHEKNWKDGRRIL